MKKLKSKKVVVLSILAAVFSLIQIFAYMPKIIWVKSGKTAAATQQQMYYDNINFIVTTAIISILFALILFFSIKEYLQAKKAGELSIKETVYKFSYAAIILFMALYTFIGFYLLRPSLHDLVGKDGKVFSDVVLKVAHEVNTKVQMILLVPMFIFSFVLLVNICEKIWIKVKAHQNKKAKKEEVTA